LDARRRSLIGGGVGVAALVRVAVFLFVFFCKKKKQTNYFSHFFPFRVKILVIFFCNGFGLARHKKGAWPFPSLFLFFATRALHFF